jgi:hypothetical protein
VLSRPVPKFEKLERLDLEDERWGMGGFIFLWFEELGKEDGEDEGCILWSMASSLDRFIGSGDRLYDASFQSDTPSESRTGRKERIKRTLITNLSHTSHNCRALPITSPITSPCRGEHAV